MRDPDNLEAFETAKSKAEAKLTKAGRSALLDQYQNIKY
jgi:hypothetical protein